MLLFGGGTWSSLEVGSGSGGRRVEIVEVPIMRSPFCSRIIGAWDMVSGLCPRVRGLPSTRIALGDGSAWIVYPAIVVVKDTGAAAGSMLAFASPAGVSSGCGSRVAGSLRGLDV